MKNSGAQVTKFASPKSMGIKIADKLSSAVKNKTIVEKEKKLNTPSFIKDSNISPMKTINLPH